jgi:hypothetical protein
VLLLRVDGVPGEHEVGTFIQTIPVAFTPGPGEASFQFDQTFWEDAVKSKGVEPPTPQAPLLDTTAILRLLEAHVQSARNNRCECGWRPENASIMNPPSAQHRLHLAELLAASA